MNPVPVIESQKRHTRQHPDGKPEPLAIQWLRNALRVRGRSYQRLTFAIKANEAIQAAAA